MADQMMVNTEQIIQIAATIDRLNNQLNDTLTTSQNTVNNLRITWKSQASDAAISSFNEFASKSFQDYYVSIDKYVGFLRQNIADGCIPAQTDGKRMSDAL